MCMHCWNERGCPTGDREELKDAVLAVHALYEVHSAGGPVHVITDDWNIDDDHRKAASEDPLALKVFDELKKLSEEKRAAALALAEGWW